MSVKITDHTLTFHMDTTRNASLFIRFMLDEVERHADPKTPKDTGDLRRNKLKQVLGLRGKIRWEMTYAELQESKQFSNYTTAGTGPHFAENAVHKAVNNSQAIMRKARLI